jgi:hypothetical protein
MTCPHDPLSTEIAAAAHQLLETWERLGRSHKMIGGGCSCGAGGIVLGLGDFEQDIVEYLSNEAERYQRRDVLALLEQCARDGARWSVAKLLAGLADPAASVASTAAKFVMERLKRTVLSFETLHGGR